MSRTRPTLLPAIASLLPLLLAAPRVLAQRPLVERSSPLQVVEPDANDRNMRRTPVVQAVERAADSVVSIYLQHRLARGQELTEGQGSGVLLDESGLAITNWHVIAPVLLGEERGMDYGVTVKLRDGRERNARILSSSPTRDLALLQLQLKADEKVKPIKIGRSADLMIGETVIAIGNPQGHANTVTTGVLSATGRSIKVRAPDNVVREYADLLQTDAAINAGNSGGALLDITGRLIGINNAMATGAENIGFAIPMDVVRHEFQRELLQSASFVANGDAPWLGIEVADQDGKVVVSEVVTGGPAAQAGVKVGDVLRGIGDRDVRSSIDYLRHFLDAGTAADLPLRVERAGQALRLAAHPITRDQGAILASIGAIVEQVDIEQDQELVYRATRTFYEGSNLRRVSPFPAVLRVRSVEPDSPAAAIGLTADDVLLGAYVDSRFGSREVPLTSRLDLSRLLQMQRGRALRIVVLRGERALEGPIDVRDDRRR